MMKTMAIAALAAATAFSQTNKAPAARQHVKEVNGQLVRFTSKLARVVELNFTMNNSHQLGKISIRDALDRIAKNYGTGTVPAFAVTHIASPADGSEKGTVPAFDLATLLSGEVIVANNISSFGHPNIPQTKKDAIQQAIELQGRGYLGFHGSGDYGGTDWPFLTQTLHPVGYKGHNQRTPGPVYKHVPEQEHIVMEGFLTTHTQMVNVPIGVDASNKPIMSQRPARFMTNEWYKFSNDIMNDPALKNKLTVLTKYDSHQIGGQLGSEFQRPGGNPYTFLLKVGKAMTSYLPAGHETAELTDATTGFDGGAGDYDRYYAQLLFFLAGYKQEPCGPGIDCAGLPMVDTLNHLKGSVGLRGNLVKAAFEFDAGKPAFWSPREQAYTAVLVDVSGRRTHVERGRGAGYHELQAPAGAGAYFLSVKFSDGSGHSRRYARLPGGL